jgi:hypothetical protein
MTVTIPDDKHTAILHLLHATWGDQCRTFTLAEAAKLLGTLISLGRVCPRGIFLFINLHQAIYEILGRNAQRLMLSPEFCKMLQQRDDAAGHPTNAARFRYFSSRVARAIWDCKAKTYIMSQMHIELAFLRQVFSNPSTYNWSSPIAHIIELEPDYEGWQDACLTGAGGFSYSLRFWWIVEWPQHIALRTICYLGKGDKSLISINMLEYVAIIISLVASIVSWELLPAHQRPVHPIALLWTDNTTAEAWTRQIAGLISPPGKALARLFAHLLMFSNMGIRAAYIVGAQNAIADYLSRLRDQNAFSSFQFRSLIQQFPRLQHCRRFQPSPKLLSLVYASLSNGYVKLPTTRIPLG